MKKLFVKSIVLAAMAAMSTGAYAALAYDQNVTNAVIYGSGNTNGGFTTDTGSGIEIGLRAKVRYPAAANTWNSNGNGTYSHATGGYGGTGNAASWNFDWSINSGTANINAYTYRLGIDYDGGAGTNFLTFDLINSANPNPLAGGLAAWDHSFGTNATTQGNGTEWSGATAAARLVSYNNLKAANNLVQNSWNLDFFDGGLFTYNANANATYSFFLEAIGANGRVLARSEMDVIVGTGAVPEPGSLALAALALAGLFGVSRRKRG